MWNRTSEPLAANNTRNSVEFTYTTSGTLQNVTGNMSVPEGCPPVRFGEMEFLPWDNPDNIVTAEVENIVRRVKDTLLFIMFLIGGPANIINMAVYYKQGLKERVNLCLFALSLADELYLIQVMFLFGEQIHLQFTTQERYGPVVRFMANNNLAGFFAFSFVSQILSAIIASERCLCVLSPLRFQTLLQTRTMAIIIVAVYVVPLGFYFVMATRYRIACVFDLTSESVVYIGATSEFYRNHEKLINYLDSFVYGAGIPMVVIVVVTTATIITAIKIRRAAAWRAGTSSANGRSLSSSSSPISPKELVLTRMLIGVAVLFIVCISPLALFRIVSLFLPDMNIGGRYHNLYLTRHSIAETLSYANATFNIFVYYTMGLRYREAFWGLLGRKRRDKATGKPSMTKTRNK